MKTIALALISLLFPLYGIAAVKQIPVYFMEALSKEDTTSSKRFHEEYKQTVEAGINVSNQDLKKCGYQITPTVEFYASSDPVQAFEHAKKAEKDGAWLIVGPRRSNHYLLLTKGVTNTPTVSTMASAKAIFELPRMNLTISPSNYMLAASAVKEALRVLSVRKNPTYLSIVKEGCLSCEDFEKGFDESAHKVGLRKIKSFKVSGDAPKLDDVKEFIEQSKNQPDIFLLPNYSKLSAYLMSELYKSSPKALFIGGDGWGDKYFGFVQHNPVEKPAKGITVRGFPPVEIGLKTFRAGKTLVDQNRFKPKSGSGMAILKAVDGVVQLLCDEKPKTKDAFLSVFEQKGPNLFNAPWGTSIYTLKNGVIEFERTVKAGAQ